MKRRCSNVTGSCEKSSPQKRKKRVSFLNDVLSGSESDISVEDDELDLSSLRDFEAPDSPEAGVVERITMTNFMCHRHLEVTLGLNVNFIVGRNGSGKSAILSALIVGLGGNASDTSRGSSVKGFIKEGCSSATLEIVIRNQGRDAFKPAQYGNSILVERKLLVGGGGGYKIKSEHNQVISTQKKELAELLDNFNIQINNPVSVLTQDVSRSFLNTSNPYQKYKLFLKATQLERLSEDYDLMIAENNVTKETLVQKKELSRALLNEVKRRKAKCREIEAVEKSHVLLEELRKELAWAVVGEKKKEVDEIRDAEKGCHLKVTQYQEQLNTMVEQTVEVENKCTDKEEEMSVLNDEALMLCNEKTELHAQYRAKRKSASQAVQASSRCQRDVERLGKDKQCLLDKIEDLNCASQRNMDEERQRRERLLEEKMLKQNVYEAQLSSSTRHLQQLEEQLLNYRGQKGELRNRLTEIVGTRDKLRKKLATLQANQRNHLSRFGRSTNDILKTIDRYAQEGKFHRRPVGPLGSCIKLKDDKWAKAVETALGRNMCAYSCHDNHDRMLLKEIFSQTGRGQSEPTVIMGYFSDYLFDTKRNRPRGCSPLLTVLDVLDIQDHLVANVLIDQCSIETVLLFEDSKLAQSIMWNRKPLGTNTALTVEGHWVIGGRCSKYYGNQDPVKYFQKDTHLAIKAIELDLLGNESRGKEISEKIKSNDQQIQKYQSKHDEAKRKFSHEQDLVHEVTMQIKELRTYEDVKIPDVDVMISEVEECESKIQKLTENWKMLNEERDEKLRESEDAETLVKDCEERCLVAGEKLENIKVEIMTLEDHLAKLNSSKSDINKKLKELQTILQEASDACKQSQSEYEDARSKALKFCGEMNISGKSVGSLNNLIEKTLELISEKEKVWGDVELTKEQYRTAEAYYIKVEKERKKCQKLNSDFQKSVQRRAKKFINFRRLIEMRTHRLFHMLLSQRGYSGKLKFDHQSETLDVMVNVENSGGTLVRDPNALSGGERSLSTVCFIMALWEAVEVPFRCLDEFDVFMDMMNRRVSINALLEIAKVQVTRQFILLTPQDMSHVCGSDRVTIFRLTDPERDEQK